MSKEKKDDTYSMIIAMMRKRDKDEREARENYQTIAKDPQWRNVSKEYEEYLDQKLKDIVTMSTVKKVA